MDGRQRAMVAGIVGFATTRQRVEFAGNGFQFWNGVAVAAVAAFAGLLFTLAFPSVAAATTAP